MDILESVFKAVEDAGIDRDRVRFVYLFGSYNESPENAKDIDVCVSLDVDKPEEAEYKLSGRVPDIIDVSVFEALPLQVRKKVFEGELLYSRDNEVYDVAYATFVEFERYKDLYETAIGA